jgi:hypothetical protein
MTPTRRRSGRPQEAGRASRQNGILYPLDFVYSLAGIAPPKVKRTAPERLPLPYRTLLSHQNDMTLTLEHHFGGRVVIRALSTHTSGPWYFRRVLLVQEYSGRPVEMGAIRIRLDAFSARVRGQILGNVVPLGRILRDGGVDYQSRPRCFLEVTPNSEMMGVFWMREPRTLYGRRTEMAVGPTKVGDIVEILPLV